MEFSKIIHELGDLLGLKLEGPDGAVGLDMDGVTVILQLAGGPRGDIIFTHADLGELPPERRDELHKIVLEANFLFQGTGGAMFALNPADGRLHLQRYDWLDRLDVKSLLNILERFSETVALWRTLIADAQKADAVAEDVGKMREGSFLQV